MSEKKSKSNANRSQKYKGLFSNIKKRYPKWKLFTCGIIVVIGIIIGLTVGLWPSNTANTAQEDDMVLVDYTGTLDDGTIFDSTTNESFNHVEPLSFTVGAGEMIYGFDRGVIGMSVNQTKTIHIPAEQAYGPKYFEVSLDALPTDPQIGETLSKTDKYGRNIQATVVNISASSAILENTAELAGEDLNFEITLIGLTKATQTSSNTSS